MPVLDRLTGLGERCRLVRGNADRELVAVRNGEWSEHAESRWAAEQLRVDHFRLLAELPQSAAPRGRWFRSRGVCHGTPRDDEEVVLVDTRLEKWTEVFAGLDAVVRTVVCGHTHMPFVRLVDRRLVINAGSIGMPYGRPGGSWALLRDGQVSLRHTPVDIDAAIAAVVAGSTYPDRLVWAEEYLRSANSDANALRVFGPRVGPVAS